MMNQISPGSIQELAALRSKLIAIAKEKAGDDAAKLSFAGVLIHAITPALSEVVQRETETLRTEVADCEAAYNVLDNRFLSAVASITEHENQTEKLKVLLLESLSGLMILAPHNGTVKLLCDNIRAALK